MQLIHGIAELRATLAAWRRAGERIALVPTMGNLHAGHIRLVERARELAPRTIASVFVNPMQFGPSEDFAAYPRTLDADRTRLAAAQLDVLFAPAVTEVYPRGLDGMTQVAVPHITDTLCGQSRPGHFTGVTTVVAKLFNMVQPDIALFGEKDWQQLQVIRRMADDLDMPIDIVGVPTVREADGLAMSSRNGYLSAAERALAPTLYAVLSAAAERLRAGERNFAAVETAAAETLDEAGLRPDYVQVRRADDLAAPGASDRHLRILAAAWLGRARLIDNCPVELPG
ncbi:pantothenate synthetase [Plasticicumulans lactativorans]|uniref:Pantothenate synthetase n=1 Tax=Plasticicumulans lactativorans TaxID=1133106 RepID=A0A4R2L9N9_9GAMM|nr:pantoate--beta-alanine ligase [Plasticicumulans lactativorans]TCO82073.1 pantothenate synthetase [Plasticicumulans lactativorans]